MARHKSHVGQPAEPTATPTATPTSTPTSTATQAPVPIAVTIEFDTVEVATDNAGETFTVAPTRNGPFKRALCGNAEAAKCPAQKFLTITKAGIQFEKGFRTGAIVANGVGTLRYFGSVAAKYGSILTNQTDLQLYEPEKGDKCRRIQLPQKDYPLQKGEWCSTAVKGVTVTGFEMALVDPARYSITMADQGTAKGQPFPTGCMITKDKDSVTCTGGKFPPMGFPAPNGKAVYLWNAVNPRGPQPAGLDVNKAKAAINPAKGSQFEDYIYMGKAIK